MADKDDEKSESKGLWGKLADAIQDPWDWAAAAAGGAAGSVVTIIAHGGDLGTSAAAGALAAVSARKALVAARAKRRLANEGIAFHKYMRAWKPPKEKAHAESKLEDQLLSELKGFDSGAYTAPQFRELLDSIKRKHQALRWRDDND